LAGEFNFDEYCSIITPISHEAQIRLNEMSKKKTLIEQKIGRVEVR